MEIYHQLGHNAVWNLESFRRDGVGNGFIMAPRHIKKDRLLKMFEVSENTKSIFDPQFFVPDTPRGNLATYDFFPAIVADGFETTEYPGTHAMPSAKKCVEFQVERGYKYIVIPNRYMTSLPVNYTSMQQNLFVDAFLRECKNQDASKPILLQIVLNEHMLRDRGFLDNILNWVTGNQAISGVYAIFEHPATSKQIKDIDYLSGVLSFVDALKQNDMTVVLGYLNTEAFLLSIAAPDIVTIGSFETTRMFNVRNFRQTENQFREQPNPRIYVPALLQLIDRNYINVIRRRSEFAVLFDSNEYREEMFKSSYSWSINRQEPYMDYFVTFSKQLQQVAILSGADRFEFVLKVIEEAREWHDKIKNANIPLDSDNDGSHLLPWFTAAYEFASSKGWE